LRERFTNKYFNDEARKVLAERQSLWSEELQRQWAALRKDIEMAAQRRVNPSSPTALALTKRHAELMEGLTGGNASVRSGLAKIWRDHANWPTEFLSKAGGAFLKAALKAAKAPKSDGKRSLRP